MLTENEIVSFISDYLEKNGFKIVEKLTTTEKGIDIIAEHQEKGRCFVEAKGETSSKSGTSKFGEPFDRNQIKTHIGAALLKTFQIKQEKGENSIVCIALPDERIHREIIETIKTCLLKVNIKVLYVNQNGNVEGDI